MRKSNQREAIWKTLAERKDHPTAESLYLALKDAWPDLSLGTVYRNLAQLCEAGLAQKLCYGGAVRYDGDVSLHTHFVCERCGAVIDVDNPVAGLRGIPFAGEITRCEVSLFGMCPDCVNHPADNGSSI
jgi:Fur family peroxide stress response transcriptional regulator